MAREEELRSKEEAEKAEVNAYLDDVEWKRKYRKEKKDREAAQKRDADLEKIRQSWKVRPLSASSHSPYTHLLFLCSGRLWIGTIFGGCISISAFF